MFDNFTAILKKGILKSTFITSIPKGRANELIDRYVRDTVIPVPGCVLCCELANCVDHSGIYIGNNRIIHRDGEVYLAEVSPRRILAKA